MINITSTVASKFWARSALVALFAVASVGFGAQAAHAALTSYMDIGTRGAEVIELQTYLSTTVLYPSKLVTGYYGPLTEAAIQKFQAAQGIVSSGTPATTGYGRVGPQTLARLNQVMTGGGIPNFSNAVPVLSAPFLSQLGTSNATITWATNEPTQGQLYWSTSPIQADEATGPGQTPYISGTLALDPNGFQTGHTATLSGLQPNTTYYYLIRAIDAQGGMSITWPSASFRTNQ